MSVCEQLLFGARTLDDAGGRVETNRPVERTGEGTGACR